MKLIWGYMKLKTSRCLRKEEQWRVLTNTRSKLWTTRVVASNKMTKKLQNVSFLSKIKVKYLIKTNINMSVCLPACVPACLWVCLYVFRNVCMYATFSGIYVNTKIYRHFFDWNIEKIIFKKFSLKLIDFTDRQKQKLARISYYHLHWKSIKRRNASSPPATSKKKLFTSIDNNWKPLATVLKSFK